MFPSGSRTREKIVKSGISVLAKENSTFLIPVKIDWVNRWTCHVYIGKPISGGINRSPENLMKYIYNL